MLGCLRGHVDGKRERRATGASAQQSIRARQIVDDDPLHAMRSDIVQPDLFRKTICRDVAALPETGAMKNDDFGRQEPGPQADSGAMKGRSRCLRELMPAFFALIDLPRGQPRRSGAVATSAACPVRPPCPCESGPALFLILICARDTAFRQGKPQCEPSDLIKISLGQDHVSLRGRGWLLVQCRDGRDAVCWQKPRTTFGILGTCLRKIDSLSCRVETWAHNASRSGVRKTKFT